MLFIPLFIGEKINWSGCCLSGWLGLGGEADFRQTAGNDARAVARGRSGNGVSMELA